MAGLFPGPVEMRRGMGLSVPVLVVRQMVTLPLSSGTVYVSEPLCRLRISTEEKDI